MAQDLQVITDKTLILSSTHGGKRLRLHVSRSYFAKIKIEIMKFCKECFSFQYRNKKKLEYIKHFCFYVIQWEYAREIINQYTFLHFNFTFVHGKKRFYDIYWLLSNIQSLQHLNKRHFIYYVLELILFHQIVFFLLTQHLKILAMMCKNIVPVQRKLRTETLIYKNYLIIMQQFVTSPQVSLTVPSSRLHLCFLLHVTGSVMMEGKGDLCLKMA